MTKLEMTLGDILSQRDLKYLDQILTEHKNQHSKEFLSFPEGEKACRVLKKPDHFREFG